VSLNELLNGEETHTDLWIMKTHTLVYII